MTKYVVVVGSIMSGLGKGILSASMAKILQMRGYNTVPLKFDGYLNVDCGTMNPFRHGEVFVLDDGGEVDMDFGTYERFLNINLTRDASITGGKLFQRILTKERKGEYLGVDVQVVPHLTNEIKNMIRTYASQNNADIVVVEVGGTVGDLENNYFIEAMRQLLSEEEGTVVQLTYVPSISPGEQKTKPTQHANKLIQSLGLKPEIIVAREQEPLQDEVKKKIAMFCNVPVNHIFDDKFVDYVYELPLLLEEQGMYDVLVKLLDLDGSRDADWSGWKSRIDRIKKAQKEIKIGVVGKYTLVHDAYVSIYEALFHAGADLSVKVSAEVVDAEKIERKGTALLDAYDGLVVPGGFGSRGVEGKIKAIEYARTHKKPLLGLCLGMQMMVVEFARNVVGWQDANSTEFDTSTSHPVIDILPEQMSISEKGGTMRLGGYEMILKPNTRIWEAYGGKERVRERHRHRYEVNPAFVDDLERAGLVIAARSPRKGIVEAVEWKDSFGIGTQAHPELSSKFERPAPLFVALVKAAVNTKKF